MPNPLYTNIYQINMIWFGLVLWEVIQFSISHLFALSLHIKVHYLNVKHWQWRDTPHSPKLQYYWSITINHCLVLYPGDSSGRGSYPSAEMQSVYSTVPADRAWVGKVVHWKVWPFWQMVYAPTKICPGKWLLWFGWVLWHINHCRLFNVKSSSYVHIKYIWFVNSFCW